MRKSRGSPVQHAICALTLLYSGLRGRPELISVSFLHYDRAIYTCRSASLTPAQTEAAFFLHFILLMYDIGCRSQRWPQDRNCWAIHLQVLAELLQASSAPKASRLKAYLSWYTLTLDSQASLAGNHEAGHYSRAFLKGDMSLPLWPIVSSPRKLFPTPEMEQSFLQAHRLNLHMFTLQAEQSQVCLRMRSASHEGTHTQKERKDIIEELSCRQRRVWEENCPAQFRSKHTTRVSADEPSITTSTFFFARLQYSVLSLYLHTSMYPQQRMDTRCFDEDDAEHCTTILKIVRQSIKNNDRDNHHLAQAVFLAGVATRCPEEKKEAIELLEEMNGGLFHAIIRIRLLLRRVISQQILMVQDGGSADEVDWVDLSDEMGMKCIVFGV